MATASNEKICRAYFQAIDTENGEKINRKWKCKCGNLRTRGNGWTNLMEHIKAAHPSYREELGIGSPGEESKLSMDSFVTLVSAKAKNIYCWMQWVVNRNKPLTFVEESESKLYSTLQPISRKTLTHYLEKVTLTIVSYDKSYCL